MISRPRATGAALALAMTLAACGSSDSSAPPTSAAPTPTTQPADPDPGDPTPTTAAPAGTSPLPAVDVLDVATGEAVALADQLPATQPLLVWFWAPH